MFKNPAELAERVLAGTPVTPDEALELLRTDDPGMLDLVAAAARLRRKHFGMTVKVNYLVNLKSGLCAEDCGYCSQRLNAGTDILKYSWLSPEQAVEQAEYGIKGGASRVCLVASGRGPSNREVGTVTRTVEALKEQHPDVEVCACLGLLKDGQAESLSGAGVDAYNHNLNTAESHYESICSTHTYQDRVDTVERAKDAGLSPCSGLIVGMRETDEQLVEAVFALRDLGSDSVPVNFLMPFEGTPLAGTWQLSPQKCLKILAVVRFVCPDKEIRMAGGREMHLRSLQPLALHVVNSLFLGDYLTSEGQAAEADLAMIADAGFTVLGAGPDPSRDRHVGPAAAQGSGAEQGSGSRRRRRAGPCADRPPVPRPVTFPRRAVEAPPQTCPGADLPRQSAVLPRTVPEMLAIRPAAVVPRRRPRRPAPACPRPSRRCWARGTAPSGTRTRPGWDWS